MFPIIKETLLFSCGPGSLANLAKGAHNLLPKGPKHLPGFLAKKFAPAAYEFKIGKPYITVRHPYSSLGEDRQQVALGETGRHFLNYMKTNYEQHYFKGVEFNRLEN